MGKTLGSPVEGLQAELAAVGTISRMCCFQGYRTQEALQLLWPNVDLHRETVYFGRTENSESRTIKLHAVVAAAHKQIWKERKKHEQGHLFLDVRGRPYADTRDYKYPGSNPLRKAHATALKRAKARPNGVAEIAARDPQPQTVPGREVVQIPRSGESFKRALAKRVLEPTAVTIQSLEETAS